MVAGIAAGAFVLSYEALRNVYLATDGPERLSFIYPLIVEGFVTVAVWVAYRLRDYGWRATAYPWTLAAAFFAYSLWSNALPSTVPAPVVTGMPSLAVPLAVHLFTHLLKKRPPLDAASELVEPVEDAQDGEEPLSDEPWPLWELPPAKTATYAASTAREGAVTASADSSALIRAWGREHGYEVKATGRIPEAVVRDFMKAHGS
ncbi:histone-like nucleoid-structuring protein Lsr2 [Streptomyces sp. NPDC004435]|uniref:DUF2637 domain-containing protein n=1 Tax=Streptomyces sp. NPDC004435 TaxID=3364701 RepID=UPI003689FD5F